MFCFILVMYVLNTLYIIKIRHLRANVEKIDLSKRKIIKFVILTQIRMKNDGFLDILIACISQEIFGNVCLYNRLAIDRCLNMCNRRCDL